MALTERQVRRDHYFMSIARSVREAANCLGSQVGAVLVVDDHIISTGYNGTPHGFTNCRDGGCVRCRDRALHAAGDDAAMSDADHVPGRALDRCICVHAEQNALLQAARFGVRAEGSTLYATLSPCFGCLKEALQAGVQADRLRARVPRGAARADRRPVPRAGRAPPARRHRRVRAAPAGRSPPVAPLSSPLVEPHADDPVAAFDAWFADALGLGLRVPEAMTLATAGADGTPSARIVLMKGHDADGFVFFTDRRSRKGADLRDNPRAALVFHWEALGRQVRAEGAVAPVDDDASYAYYRTRPRGSQIGAWASHQSAPIASRADPRGRRWPPSRSGSRASIRRRSRRTGAATA